MYFHQSLRPIRAIPIALAFLVISTLVTAGATLDIGEDEFACGVWTIPAGSPTPNSFSLFTSGTLELLEAGTQPGAVIAGSFSGVFWTAAADTGN